MTKGPTVSNLSVVDLGVLFYGTLLFFVTCL